MVEDESALEFVFLIVDRIAAAMLLGKKVSTRVEVPATPIGKRLGGSPPSSQGGAGFIGYEVDL